MKILFILSIFSNEKGERNATNEEALREYEEEIKYFL